MNHKLNLKAAAAYGHLIDMVPVLDRKLFAKTFEDFLNAYDGETVQETATKDDAQITSPKVGDVYKDIFKNRFKVIAVIAGSVVVTQTVKDDTEDPIIQFGSLERFSHSNLVKED